MAELEIRAILKDEFSAQAQKIVGELKQIGSEGTKASAELRSGMASVGGAVAATTSKIDDQSAALKQQGMTWTDLTAKYYLASQALSVVSGAAMSVVDAVSRYDSITVRLNAFEGSAAAGAKAFEKLQVMAKQPGLGLEQASSAYASLRALKESGPEAVAIIEAVAKANASMGGGAQEFGRAMAQIQQMLGKGKLMAEDINVISESIPNFRALILDAFGTTDTKALNAKYSVDQLLKGIEEAAAKLPPPGETIKNNMDNIGDAWTRLKASIGDAGFIKSATGAMAGFLDMLASSLEGEKKITGILSDIDRATRNSDEDFLGRLMKNASRGSGNAFETGIGATSASEGGGSYAAYMADRAGADERLAAARAGRPPDPDSAKKATKAAEDAAKARLKTAYDAADEERKTAERLAAWQKRINDDAEKADAKRADKKAADRAANQKAENAALLAEQKRVDAIRDKFDRDQAKKEEARIERKEKAKSAVAMRFAEGSVSAAMVAFSPVDAMFDRMAQRNAEMEMGFSRVTQGMALSFTSMLIKMAEEYAARAAIFGILSFIPGMGGATGLMGGLGSFVFGGRASGGAMFPGVSYAYNERQGGEIFRPSTGGMASPNLQGRAGDSITINLSGGATQADANRVARAIEQQGRGRLRTVTRRG